MPDNDQLGQLQSQVNDVKDVMTQNIEKVMERGERLEDLIATTDNLEAHVSAKYLCRLLCRVRKEMTGHRDGLHNSFAENSNGS